MNTDTLEKFAIRCALGNNGGTWVTHYTEEQKEHWRQFVSDLSRAITDGMPPIGRATEPIGVGDLVSFDHSGNVTRWINSRCP